MNHLKRYWYAWFVAMPAFTALQWLGDGPGPALVTAVAMVVAFQIGRVL